MALFGSTSPSFPVLASIDQAQAWWRREGPDAYRTTAQRVSALRRTAEAAGFLAPGGDGFDPARLTLGTVGLGLSGIRAAEAFRRCGCEPEHADARMVVFIVTPFNTEEDIRRLDKAIRRVPELCIRETDPEAFDPFGCGIPAKRMRLRQAALMETDEIPSEKPPAGSRPGASAPARPALRRWFRGGDRAGAGPTTAGLGHPHRHGGAGNRMTARGTGWPGWNAGWTPHLNRIRTGGRPYGNRTQVPDRPFPG